eukprot:Ihof_evm3s556 gene=Ihof_evmTU3s556
MVLYVLYESASGYGLFETVESEGVALKKESVQEAIQDLARFGKVCKLKAFVPFTTAQMALENINCISEGIVHEYLHNFLEAQMPKVKEGKKTKTFLGIGDSKLGAQISEELGIQCQAEDVVKELIRGIRLHFSKFISAMRPGDLEKAQLGLGHSYSRAKVKFNVNRSDNMIIQAISLLDQLDKDINTFAMRAKEWNSYAFPELAKIVTDSYQYAKVAKLVGNHSTLKEDKLEAIEAIVDDSAKAKQILMAARSSMGMDVGEVDLFNISKFLDRVIELTEYRSKLHTYLETKMATIAPNLSKLIGEMVGARLISQAGSLTNLAKYPASTVQILGAEKALFRALKTRGNTPKYGLIYHSSFIGRAGAKNKGRISRYLANKCSIASRIDCFSDNPTDKFGEVMHEQVEDRLKFYETGEAPRKNAEVMKEVLDTLKAFEGEEEDEEEEKETKKESKKGKKEKKEKKESKKESKKEKKRKHESDDEEEEEEAPKKEK